MHILTKIFAVIAAVLSLIVATLASVHSLNAGTIRKDYQKLTAMQDASAAALKSQATERSEQISSLLIERQAARDEASMLRAEIAQLETELDTLDAEKAQAEADKAQVTRQIGQLGATVQTQQALIASYREEVNDLRAGELAFREREINLIDRLSDLESQNGVLDQTVRALQVELTDLQSRLAQGPTGAGGEGVVEIYGDRITGEVVSVETDAGRQIAQVDLGSRDRMRNRARLYILRDGSYLAEMILESVDLDTSVGVVEALGASITVQPGDTVVTSLSSGTGG